MSTNKQSSEKFTKEELNEVKSLMRNSRIPSALAIVVLGITAYALINHKVDFSKYQSTTAQNLTDIGPRIKYVIQHSAFSVLWLLLCIFYVGSKRTGTPAVNPLAGHEKLAEAAKNILTNSVEQFIMSFVSQLILVTHLEPNCILNVIPVINLLFIIGRITFWLGYPKYRSFGFMVTVLPTIVMIFFNAYKLVKLYT